MKEKKMEKLWCVGVSYLDIDLDKLDLNNTDLRVILYEYDKEMDELLARVCKKSLEENFKGLVGKFRVRKEPLPFKGIFSKTDVFRKYQRTKIILPKKSF